MTSGATGLLRNRFERRAFGPGLVGWLYEYGNRRPLPIPDLVSTGFEIDVQLQGEWWYRGWRGGARAIRTGEIGLVSPSERHTYSFRRGKAPGVQVGFTVYPGELERYAGPGGALVASPRASRRDDRLLELCRHVREALERGATPATADVRDAVLGYLDASIEVLPPDAVTDAKAEIDRTFARPLYLEHFSAIAGMHPVTFSRAFIRRFGVTPTRYRVELRINHAIRLAWSRPDLGLRAIAEECGFDDLSYFHRAFTSKFGLTLSQLGRRRSTRQRS